MPSLGLHVEKNFKTCSGRCKSRSDSNLDMNIRQWRYKSTYDRCISNRLSGLRNRPQRTHGKTGGKEKEESA